MGNASGPVVVGIDGSDAAIYAAIGAIDEAIDRDVPMRMVHVTRDEQHAGARDDYRLEIQYAATALRVAAAVVEATGKQVKIETEIICGATVSALINESRRASLICLGPVGIGADASKLLGSTAAMLVENAFCPVAIVRAPRIASEDRTEPIAVVMEDRIDSERKSDDESVQLAVVGSADAGQPTHLIDPHAYPSSGDGERSVLVVR